MGIGAHANTIRTPTHRAGKWRSTCCSRVTPNRCWRSAALCRSFSSVVFCSVHDHIQYGSSTAHLCVRVSCCQYLFPPRVGCTTTTTTRREMCQTCKRTLRNPALDNANGKCTRIVCSNTFVCVFFGCKVFWQLASTAFSLGTPACVRGGLLIIIAQFGWCTRVGGLPPRAVAKNNYI